MATGGQRSVLGALGSDLGSLESPFFVLVADRQVKAPGSPPMAIHDAAGLSPIVQSQ